MTKPLIKIGTKLEVIWTQVRDCRKATIKELETSLIIEKAFLRLAEEKILLEQRK